jgi:hypothetical protein
LFQRERGIGQISTQLRKTGQAALRRVARRRSIRRMKRKIAVCAALALFVLASCARKPEEQRLREAIGSMQVAVESGQPRDFMAYLSTDFTGQDGSIDHDGLANILRAEVLRNDKIGVTLGPIGIEIQGDRATAHLIATLTGGSGGLLPERGEVYTIVSGWKKDGRSWRCYNATWSQQL